MKWGHDYKSFFLKILFFLFPFQSVQSSIVNSEHFSLGAFVDTYYAYDFNKPLSSERAYTTLPLRNNEFNLNLAYLEAQLKKEEVRGRFALQVGNSVQVTYSGENNALGVYKGSIPAGLIQEASAGYRLLDNLWIESGIFLSYIGFESFITKDNWTYSRSFVADFSPYYESGVKLSLKLSPVWSTEFHFLNGWNNIFEINQGKAVGLQLAFDPSGKTKLNYNLFIGNEVSNLTRIFHDLIMKYDVSDSISIAHTLDFGTQVKPGFQGVSLWYGWAAFGKLHLSSKVTLTARIEHYSDPDQVIVMTHTPHGFNALGASINTNVNLAPELMWRTELRGLTSKDELFPSSTALLQNSKFIVTSFLLSI